MFSIIHNCSKASDYMASHYWYSCIVYYVVFTFTGYWLARKERVYYVSTPFLLFTPILSRSIFPLDLFSRMFFLVTCLFFLFRFNWILRGFTTVCTVLYCTVLYFIALHCTALHCTALHCTALHCTAENLIQLFI